MADRSGAAHPRRRSCTSMQAHLAKYRSLMPSLALLFALADGHTDSVPISHARLACDWCDYLETHANRVYSAQARPEHHAAIALSKRLAKGWKRVEGILHCARCIPERMDYARFTGRGAGRIGGARGIWLGTEGACVRFPDSRTTERDLFSQSTIGG